MSSAIKNITAEQTIPVRHAELRQGKPIESCVFDGDDLAQHFGFYIDEELVGIVSVFESRSDVFKSALQFQMRGMAVVENHQYKGIGADLVRHVESNLQNGMPKILWFNARESAVGFYKKLGYKIIGEPLNIADVGTHFIMYKEL